MRKKVLSTIVSFLFLVGIGFGMLPFVKSLSQNAASNKPDIAIFDYAKLQEGIPYFPNLKSGYPIIILKPSKEQLASIKLLDPFVADKSWTTYNKELGIFIYEGYGKKNDYYCSLKHYPEGSKPDYFGHVDLWLGGYWDPTCEASYDYAGRVIVDSKHSFNSFVSTTDNLNTFSIAKLAGSEYAVIKLLKGVR